jgi:hypothetical protein
MSDAFWLMVACVLFPVVGVVFGVGYSMLARYMRHRERIAMIENGIDPRQPRGEQPPA